MKKVILTTIFATLMICSSLFYVSCSKEKKTDGIKQNLDSNQALTLNKNLGGSMYVGYRDATDNSILDVNEQEIRNFFNKQVVNEGAHTFTLDGIFINDNPLEEGYFPSLIVEFTFFITETITVDSIVSTEDVSHSARIQYVLHYDEIENKYLLLDEDDLPSEINGGRLACL